MGDGRALEFVKDQYRHCKPLLVVGQGADLLKKAGIPMTLPSGERDPGLVVSGDEGEAAIDAFIQALARHRHFERETDPPRV
jgi:catalase